MSAYRFDDEECDPYTEAMEAGFNARYDDHYERYNSSQLDHELEAFYDSGCESYDEWFNTRATQPTPLLSSVQQEITSPANDTINDDELPF